MELRRRFIFRGNAAAIGGRIVRPSDLIIDSTVTSSLTVSGGRSRERAGPARFGELVSFGAAATSAEGLFDDVQQQIEYTFGKIPQDALTTTTRVSADVSALVVGTQPKLTIRRLHAALNSKSPAGSNEPSIAPGTDTVIDGVAIDGKPLTLEMATAVFQQHDTRSKLLTAADDPKFVAEFGDCLYMKHPRGGVAAPPTGRVQYGSGILYATIVKSIKWAAEPVDGVTFDVNSVVVPNFGRVFFGELLITGQERRLTMVRVELGSPTGGEVACAEVDSNGTWSN